MLDRKKALGAVAVAAVAGLGFLAGGTKERRAPVEPVANEPEASGPSPITEHASEATPARAEEAPPVASAPGPRFVTERGRLVRVEGDRGTLTFAWEGSRVAGFDVARDGAHARARVRDGVSTIDLTSPDGRTARIERDRLHGTARFTTPAGRIYGVARTGTRRVRVSGPFGTVDLELDEHGRVASWRDSSDRSAEFTRDDRGLPTRIEAGSEIETFAYDESGRAVREESAAGVVTRPEPTTRSRREGRVETLETVAGTFVFEHDELGPVVRATYPNGVVHERGIERGRVARDSFVRHGEFVLALEHVRDEKGRRTLTRRDGRATRFAYDAKGRLESFSSERGEVAFDHDADDAVTARVDSTGRTEIELDELGRISSAGEDHFEHDGAGRVTARIHADGSVDRFVYDGFGRLASVVRAGKPEVSYVYDARGRVASRTVAGETTRFIYEGLHRVAEVRDGHERRYVWGPGIDEPLAYVEDGRATFLHANELGHVLAYTDERGKKVAEAELDPFGRVLAAPGSRPVFFAGRIWDADAELYDLRARFYDPELGRFLTPDPSGLSGGFDAYGYCRSNPVDAIDPLGLWPWDPVVDALPFEGSPAQKIYDLLTGPGLASAAGTRRPAGSDSLRKALGSVEDIADEIDRRLGAHAKGEDMETTRALLFLAGEVLGFGAAQINGIGELTDFLDDLERGAVDLLHDKLIPYGDRWAEKFEPKSALMKAFFEHQGGNALASIVTEWKKRIEDGSVETGILCENGQFTRAGVAFGKSVLNETANTIAITTTLANGAIKVGARALGAAPKVPVVAPVEGPNVVGIRGALLGEESAGIAPRAPATEAPTVPAPEAPTASPAPVAVEPQAVSTETAPAEPMTAPDEVPEDGLPFDKKWGRRLPSSTSAPSVEPPTDPHASTPVGRIAGHVEVNGGTVGVEGGPFSVQSGTNAPRTIGGRDFSGHAIDQMQARGVPPSVVENTIKCGRQEVGKVAGTTAYYDPVNKVTVITDASSGRVVTVSTGRIKQ
jgi:RHS repeat-associated protein